MPAQLLVSSIPNARTIKKANTKKKTATNRQQKAVAAVKDAGNPGISLLDAEKENPPALLDAEPTRPVRLNRGKGGQLDQLEKTLKVMDTVTRKNKKRGQADSSLVDAPEDLPLNDMAPAPKAKRQRTANQNPLGENTFRVPSKPDAPLILQMPRPSLRGPELSVQEALPTQRPIPALPVPAPPVPAPSGSLLNIGFDAPHIPKSPAIATEPRFYFGSNAHSYANHSSSTNGEVHESFQFNLGHTDHHSRADTSHSGLHLDLRLPNHTQGLDQPFYNFYDDTNQQHSPKHPDSNAFESDHRIQQLHDVYNQQGCQGNEADDEDMYQNDSEKDQQDHWDDEEKDFEEEEEGDGNKAEFSDDDSTDDDMVYNMQEFPESQLPPDFDERSPSEDERDAQAVLQNSNVHDKHPSIDSAHNVLQAHHMRNRANKPPSTEILAVAAAHQHRLGGQYTVNQNDKDDDEDEEDEDEDDNEETSRKRAPRHSRSTGTNPKPTTMAFYPGAWRVILQAAKVRFRRHIFLNQAFPLRSKDLDVATRLLGEEIARFEVDGVTLDHSYSQTREMAIVIFNEGSTARGRLKAVTRAMVGVFYSSFLVAEDFYVGNQLEEQQIIQRQVENALEGGLYMEGPKDSEGRTSNLSHPCIEHICLQYFYQEEDSLAHHFPNDFKDSIPERAIALVITAIHNCLEEYILDGSRQERSFKGKFYQSVHDRILALMNEVKSNAYHAQKFDRFRRDIARKGLQTYYEPREGTTDP